MEIDDKGGEIVQRYESFGEIETKKQRLDMDMDSRGWTWTKREQH